MNIFLDTMVYLHCQPINQIDFCEIFNTSTVKILIPRITLKELDNHKTAHKSARIRERAKKTLVLLKTKIDSGTPIRKGVLIEYITHIPKVDMSSYGLYPDWNDDLLIASILDYMEIYSHDTVLVTHDIGLQLKCKQLSIATYELPQEYHIPPEVDEKEKENQRLKKEIDKLRNALPSLDIVFDEQNSKNATFTLETPIECDETKITEIVSRLKAEYPELPEKIKPLHENNISPIQLFAVLAKADLAFGSISKQEYARYNTERITYFEKYEQYLRDMNTANNFMKRTIRFAILIRNSGTAPADDVDIYLHFPDGFKLYTDKNFSVQPSEPKPPQKPRNALEMLNANIQPMSSFYNLIPPQRLIPEFEPPESSFHLRKTNSYEITDHFARIKHGYAVTLPELFLTFDTYTGARSFNCDYEISAANLPEPKRGELHFIVKNDT